MRNKDAIFELVDESTKLVDRLEAEMDSGKPHVTAPYVKQQLVHVQNWLHKAIDLLNLESQ